MKKQCRESDEILKGSEKHIYYIVSMSHHIQVYVHERLTSSCNKAFDNTLPGWGLACRYVDKTPYEDMDIAYPLLSLTFSPIMAATSVIAFSTVLSPLNLGCSTSNLKPCSRRQHEEMFKVKY